MLVAFVATAAFAGAPAAWSPPALPACSNIPLLVTHDYAYVQQHICELCGKSNPDLCELDWPSSDVPACSFFDELRNGIYAYYGRAFETDQWKAYFAKQAWYRVNPTYSDALLSPAAQRNVPLLKSMASSAACVK